MRTLKLIAVSVCALVVVTLTAAGAHAQDAPCDPKKRDCGCEKDWGCWELLYSTRGTVLGVKGTTSYAQGGDGLQGSLVTAYSTEHYGTRKGLSGHVAAAGTIGGGSAGNEGSLSAAVDFGWRAPVERHSGPFLRAGMNGLLFGNAQLRLSILEPVQARLGYQFLDGDALFEWGLTAGYAALGRYRPGDERRRALGGSPEVGGYLAMHMTNYRVDVGMIRLPDESNPPGTALDLLRAAACFYPRPVAVCVDLFTVTGSARLAHGGSRASHATYAGLTLGLTP